MSQSRLCCPLCFDDRYFTRQLFPSVTVSSGECSYCGAKDQPLVAPETLCEQFELLIEAYKPDSGGISLVENLKRDWLLFPRLNVAHAKELMSDILDDGQIVRQPFVIAEPPNTETLLMWQSLREELMHANRYFPRHSIDLERLSGLLPHLLLKEDEVGTDWFRARLQGTELAYPPEQMGAPPSRLATHGRANPAGIPYLYVASAVSTAISEVRPHRGDIVNVASVELPTGLQIVDLRQPRRTVSPFVLQDDSEIRTLLGDIGFLERLGEELTRPILQKSAAYDYIPSQYVCEFVKRCGFDGVMYRSSVGAGENLALFDPTRVTIHTVTSHAVAGVSVHSEAIGNATGQQTAALEAA